jgi:hypothetical protein
VYSPGVLNGVGDEQPSPATCQSPNWRDLTVHIGESPLGGEGSDVGGGFVVAGDDEDAIGFGLHDFAGAIEAARPTDEVSGGEVVVGVDGHEALEGAVVAVDVGEEEDAHRVCS